VEAAQLEGCRGRLPGCLAATQFWPGGRHAWWNRGLLPALAALCLALAASGGLRAQELAIGVQAVVAGTDGEGLRLRQEPGLSAALIGLLAEGTRLRVLDGPRPADGEQWYQVRAGDQQGWAAARYLRELPDRAALAPLASVGASGAPTTLRVQVVGYHVPAARNPRTSTGTVPRWGTVAVDPRVIPLGTRLLIEGFEGTVFVAEDTGRAVQGLVVDIWFDDPESARRFGTQTRTITLLGR
jgi:3D (Asp-Asp-Asp) domain-containing protein